jgi:hypothetical protein
VRDKRRDKLTRIVWVSLHLSLNLVKLKYQDSVGIFTLVPQSSQTKYQNSVGISMLVPQSSQAKFQDSVGISTLVPQSSQTHQDSVGTSTLVPQSSQTKYPHTILVFKFD